MKWKECDEHNCSLTQRPHNWELWRSYKATFHSPFMEEKAYRKFRKLKSIKMANQPCFIWILFLCIYTLAVGELLSQLSSLCVGPTISAGRCFLSGKGRSWWPKGRPWWRKTEGKLGDRKEDLGDQTEDLGDQREHLGDQREDLGDRMEDLGHQPKRSEGELLAGHRVERPDRAVSAYLLV